MSVIILVLNRILSDFIRAASKYYELPIDLPYEVNLSSLLFISFDSTCEQFQNKLYPPAIKFAQV